VAAVAEALSADHEPHQRAGERRHDGGRDDHPGELDKGVRDRATLPRIVKQA
jgi:hypothetical protein